MFGNLNNKRKLLLDHLHSLENEEFMGLYIERVRGKKREVVAKLELISNGGNFLEAKIIGIIVEERR